MAHRNQRGADAQKINRLQATFEYGIRQKRRSAFGPAAQVGDQSEFCDCAWSHHFSSPRVPCYILDALAQMTFANEIQEQIEANRSAKPLIGRCGQPRRGEFR